MPGLAHRTEWRRLLAAVTEFELAVRLSETVSRSTLDRVLKELIKAKTVTRQKGKGSRGTAYGYWLTGLQTAGTAGRSGCRHGPCPCRTNLTSGTKMGGRSLGVLHLPSSMKVTTKRWPC